MRDLNLGPDTKKLVQQWDDEVKRQRTEPYDFGKLVIIGAELTNMLERWLGVGWCWPDACPATICGGPHVIVRYKEVNGSGPVDIVEPVHRAGTTFEGAEYVILDPEVARRPAGSTPASRVIGGLHTE